MALFAEDVIQEYTPIEKRKTPTKTVSYRIRVLRRKIDGIMYKMVDIREFMVNDRKALFTESGIYLNTKELSDLIKTLQEIRNAHFNG